jgi:hypothetical protein
VAEITILLTVRMPRLLQGHYHTISALRHLCSNSGGISSVSVSDTIHMIGLLASLYSGLLRALTLTKRVFGYLHVEDADCTSRCKTSHLEAN